MLAYVAFLLFVSFLHSIIHLHFAIFLGLLSALKSFLQAMYISYNIQFLCSHTGSCDTRADSDHSWPLREYLLF